MCSRETRHVQQTRKLRRCLYAVIIMLIYNNEKYEMYDILIIYIYICCSTMFYIIDDVYKTSHISESRWRRLRRSSLTFLNASRIAWRNVPFSSHRPGYLPITLLSFLERHSISRESVCACSWLSFTRISSPQLSLLNSRARGVSRTLHFLHFLSCKLIFMYYRLYNESNIT